VGTLYCDFEDPRQYREAVARGQERNSSTSAPLRTAIYLAPPRIFKTGEEGVLRHIASCRPDGILARNIDHLEFFKGWHVVGDYSLNVANRWAAEVFRERYAPERLTASYDLDHRQLAALLRSAPAEWFEITVHQHMPMFHMEHCVFCAFLSQGTDSSNCGRPCDRHEVRLKDRTGVEHPVVADVGCRNTVFNGVAQTGAEHLASLIALGARRFRLEFVHETADQVIQTIASYRSLLRGEPSGSQLWLRLKLLSHLGVTRGPMG
jgi:putative protease